MQRVTGANGASDSRGERLAPVTYLPGAQSVTPDPDPRADPRRDRQRPGGSFDRISNVSMYALARRAMSIADMRDYLVTREFEANDIDIELERLISAGLLNDVDLGRTLSRRLQERKGLGRTALIGELRRKRLDPVAIETVVAELDSSGDDERALELAMRRAPQLERLDAETARRRLGAFLMRKGYSGEIVQRALEAALPRSAGTPRSGFSSGSRNRGSSGGPVFR